MLIDGLFSNPAVLLIFPGTPLKQLAVDSYTITEVLRLHFLASGAKTPSNLVRYHYQQRGGYSPSDDAGLEFRREEPQILKALGHGNVFDLTPGKITL